MENFWTIINATDTIENVSAQIREKFEKLRKRTSLNVQTLWPFGEQNGVIEINNKTKKLEQYFATKNQIKR